MMKILFHVAIVFLLIISNNCFAESVNVHEMKKVFTYFVNTDESGITLISADYNKKNKQLELQFTWDGNTNDAIKTSVIGVGEINNDYSNYQEIKSLSINATPLQKGGSLHKTIVPLFLKNEDSKLILWVKSINPPNRTFKSISKENLLDRVKAIIQEQSRLQYIIMEKGRDALVNELSKTFSE